MRCNRQEGITESGTGELVQHAVYRLCPDGNGTPCGAIIRYTGFHMELERQATARREICHKAVFEKEIATSPKSGTVSVKNKGKGALSVDLITRTQLLNDTLPAIADNIRLDVKYTDMAGSPISVEDIRQGTDFMSAVTLSNISGTSDYSNLALTHIIPSGWEIYNERMIIPEASSSNSNEANTPESSADKYTYKDIYNHFGCDGVNRKHLP